MARVEEKVKQCTRHLRSYISRQRCNNEKLTSGKHMRNLQPDDRQMTTANEDKLTIASVSRAGNLKDIYYASEASDNNVVDIYIQHHR